MENKDKKTFFFQIEVKKEDVLISDISREDDLLTVSIEVNNPGLFAFHFGPGPSDHNISQ